MDMLLTAHVWKTETFRYRSARNFWSMRGTFEPLLRSPTLIESLRNRVGGSLGPQRLGLKVPSREVVRPGLGDGDVAECSIFLWK